MLMTCENGHAHSTGAGNDEPMIGANPVSEPASGLGGWRPASFAAGRPQPPRQPTYAFLAEERLAAKAAAAPSAGGCREGLAGLFSSKPQARSITHANDHTVVSSIEPRIETDRLVLRVLNVRDFDDYFAVAGDPETFRYSHRGGMSSDEAWTRLLRHVGHWSLLGWGLFAIEEKATGRFVGEAGFGDFHRGIGPDFDGVPEGGCTIARWAQRSGYATEAMRGALGWIERKLQPPRTVCLVHSQNRKSIRVAEKLGYEAFDQRQYRGFEAILFERLRRPA
jgi:RimJ/RimL family protein N-acetyltransferase